VSQMSPEELAAYDAKTRELIDEAELEVAASESSYESRKEAAANAKKLLEGDEIALRKLIRDRREMRGKKPQQTLLDHADTTWRESPLSVLELPEELLTPIAEEEITNVGELFDALDGGADFGLSADDLKSLNIAVAEYRAKPPAPATPDDLFKQYPIERWAIFGITPKDIEKLHAGEIKAGGVHPIITVGDLQNFVTPNPANPAFARGYGDLKGIGPAGVDRIAEAELKFWGWWKNGGETEFATEKGYGNAPVAGDGSEVPGDGDPDDTPIEGPNNGELALVGVERGEE
jgi:hypothetical protein